MKQTANTIGAAVDAIEELLSEIERYLGAVELFRALGCEPSWRPELGFESTALAWLPGSSCMSRT